MAKRSTVAPPRETLNEYVDRCFHEYDTTIEKLQRRIEALERANLDVIAFLQWKAKQKGKRS